MASDRVARMNRMIRMIRAIRAIRMIRMIRMIRNIRIIRIGRTDCIGWTDRSDCTGRASRTGCIGRTSHHREMPHSVRGLTLLEVVVAVAIVSILAGAMVPMIVAQADREKLLGTIRELDTLDSALAAYFGDHGAFPAALDAPDFLGVYLAPGVNQEAITDAWGADRTYRYFCSQGREGERALLLSVGPDGQFDRGEGDDITCRVYGAVAGNRRTRARLDLISGALERFLAGGGQLAGDWQRTDRAALGLGPTFERDGFGTPFQSSSQPLSIRSAGADRRFHTEDDLTL
jgi:prepilin-type N-terminal cleavage/methylation domain-containing protein